MWTLNEELQVEYKCMLSRHAKGVNVVRFSPAFAKEDGTSQVYLASAGDDNQILIWKDQGEINMCSPEAEGSAEDVVIIDGFDEEEKSTWQVELSLRGHCADVYDIAWSPASHGEFLVSGSIDNTVIVWDVLKSRPIHEFKHHEKFVRGVAWDASGELIASMSCDRTCQIYALKQIKRAKNNRIKQHFTKSSTIKKSVLSENGIRSVNFHDDNIPVYFSRISFSPDGKFLFIPGAEISAENSIDNMLGALVYLRNKWNRPWRVLPGFTAPTTAVAVSPVCYSLQHQASPSMSAVGVKHRWIFAVVSMNAVAIYDTERFKPISIVRNFHLAQVTDSKWSLDGKFLGLASTDGYCSFLKFSEGELGVECSFQVAFDSRLQPLKSLSCKDTEDSADIEGEPASVSKKREKIHQLNIKKSDKSMVQYLQAIPVPQVYVAQVINESVPGSSVQLSAESQKSSSSQQLPITQFVRHVQTQTSTAPLQTETAVTKRKIVPESID
jgi:chromatin assembly factor 1 subunit B